MKKNPAPTSAAASGPRRPHPPARTTAGDGDEALLRELCEPERSQSPRRSDRLLFDPQAPAPGGAPAPYPSFHFGTKLRTIPIEVAIAEHYGKRRTSLEEAILEVYHADLSVKRAEDLSQTLWGKRVRLGRISELARRIDERIVAWLEQPLGPRFPYVYLDGTPLRRYSSNDAARPSVLVAVGINRLGLREVLGVAEGSREDAGAVEAFWRSLRRRGLDEVQLIVGDRTPAAMQATKRVFPHAAYQACTTQFREHALALTSGAELFRVTEVVQQIHANANARAAREAAARAAATLRSLELGEVASFIEEAIGDTLTFYRFPKAHWPVIHSNDSLRRILREVRERARVVGAFSDNQSAVVMVGARLRQIARKTWDRYRYLKPAPASAEAVA